MKNNLDLSKDGRKALLKHIKWRERDKIASETTLPQTNLLAKESRTESRNEKEKKIYIRFLSLESKYFDVLDRSRYRNIKEHESSRDRWQECRTDKEL